MTITVHSTTKIVELDGVPCRLWEGHTERGVEIHCFIARVAVHNDLDHSQFMEELAEQAKPSAEGAVYPIRMIL